MIADFSLKFCPQQVKYEFFLLPAITLLLKKYCFGLKQKCDQILPDTFILISKGNTILKSKFKTPAKF